MPKYQTPFERLKGQTVTDVDFHGDAVVIKLADAKGRETSLRIGSQALEPTVQINRDGP